MDNILIKNSYPVNDRIVKHFKDNKPAVILGFLMSEYCKYCHVGAVKENDWFYKTVEDVEEVTALSKSQQRNAIQLLISAEMLEMKIDKIDDKHPNRMRYFRFTEHNINAINKVVNFFTDGQQKFYPPSNKNLTTVGEKINHGQQKNELPSAKNSTTVGKKIDLNNIYNNLYNKFDNIPAEITKALEFAVNRETLFVNGNQITSADFIAKTKDLNISTVKAVFKAVNEKGITSPGYICTALYNACNGSQGHSKPKYDYSQFDINKNDIAADTVNAISMSELYSFTDRKSALDYLNGINPDWTNIKHETINICKTYIKNLD